jgi:hypothetical protein
LDDFFNGVKKKKKEDDDDEPEPTTEDFNRTINLSGQAKRPRGRPRKNPE